MGNRIFRLLNANFFFLISTIAIFGFGTGQAFSATRVISTQDHVKGQLVVKLRDSATGKRAEAVVISAIQRALGENSVLEIRPFQTDRSLSLIRIADDRGLHAAISALKAEPSVEVAEPNYIYRAFDDGVPNDPDFSKTWGLKNTGQPDPAGQIGKPGSDINVMPLWQQGFRGDRKVVVAIIDTGIDWEHPDLKANLFTNTKEIDGNKKDDDGNGFIDDVHGWNTAGNNGNSRDDHNHGTHCAGTIGGVGNNGLGVVGVNWEVTLMPVKFLDASGSGSLQGAVEAINYARLMKVNIMSNSWGGGGFSEILKQAIEETKKAGIIFVAAAGNEKNNNDANPTYPAGYAVDNVIAVAATDNQDKLANFSNYGVRTVHVAAPGVKVYSTVRGGKYDSYSGTSMATPHVSGISALLLAANPTWTFGEIKDRLIKSSDPVPNLKSKVIARGRVNAYNAFHGIIPPNNEPDESLWKDVPFVVESEHPYAKSTDQKWEISHPGAKYIRVHFEKIDTEAGYDKVSVESPAGETLDELSGQKTDAMSEYFQGDKVFLHFQSDTSVQTWGFKVDRIQVITDSTLRS